ncbi:Microtubule-associated protein 4 [Acipenser ruthenus]|uniref:Microtubule-associated protein 4 n=1 Tax=Acipenser ruthenus TaxID=7906 RepID=A0A444U356_ACIRT|nr:Microtubule-associated protein 4 [Acipenser ruthenus]
MADLDLSLSDALEDSPPPGVEEPVVQTDFIASLEAEKFDDVVGETVDKTDYCPLLDNDEEPKSKSSATSEKAVLENGEHDGQEAQKTDLTAVPPAGPTAPASSAAELKGDDAAASVSLKEPAHQITEAGRTVDLKQNVAVPSAPSAQTEKAEKPPSIAPIAEPQKPFPAAGPPKSPVAPVTELPSTAASPATQPLKPSQTEGLPKTPENKSAEPAKPPVSEPPNPPDMKQAEASGGGAVLADPLASLLQGWTDQLQGNRGFPEDLPLFTPSVSTVINKHTSQSGVDMSTSTSTTIKTTVTVASMPGVPGEGLVNIGNVSQQVSQVLMEQAWDCQGNDSAMVTMLKTSNGHKSGHIQKTLELAPGMKADLGSSGGSGGVEEEEEEVCEITETREVEVVGVVLERKQKKKKRRKPKITELQEEEPEDPRAHRIKQFLTELESGDFLKTEGAAGSQAGTGTAEAPVLEKSQEIAPSSSKEEQKLGQDGGESEPRGPTSHLAVATDKQRHAQRRQEMWEREEGAARNKGRKNKQQRKKQFEEGTEKVWGGEVKCQGSSVHSKKETASTQVQEVASKNNPDVGKKKVCEAVPEKGTPTKEFCEVPGMKYSPGTKEAAKEVPCNMNSEKVSSVESAELCEVGTEKVLNISKEKVPHPGLEEVHDGTLQVSEINLKEDLVPGVKETPAPAPVVKDATPSAPAPPTAPGASCEYLTEPLLSCCNNPVLADPLTSLLQGWTDQLQGSRGFPQDLPLFTPSVSTVINKHTSQSGVDMSTSTSTTIKTTVTVASMPGVPGEGLVNIGNVSQQVSQVLMEQAWDCQGNDSAMVTMLKTSNGHKSGHIQKTLELAPGMKADLGSGGSGGVEEEEEEVCEITETREVEVVGVVLERKQKKKKRRKPKITELQEEEPEDPRAHRIKQFLTELESGDFLKTEGAAGSQAGTGTAEAPVLEKSQEIAPSSSKEEQKLGQDGGESEPRGPTSHLAVATDKQRHAQRRQEMWEREEGAARNKGRKNKQQRKKQFEEGTEKVWGGEVKRQGSSVHSKKETASTQVQEVASKNNPDVGKKKVCEAVPEKGTPTKEFCEVPGMKYSPGTKEAAKEVPCNMNSEKVSSVESAELCEVGTEKVLNISKEKVPHPGLEEVHDGTLQVSEINLKEGLVPGVKETPAPAPVVKDATPSAPAPPTAPGVKQSSAPGVNEAPAPASPTATVVEDAPAPVHPPAPAVKRSSAPGVNEALAPAPPNAAVVEDAPPSAPAPVPPTAPGVQKAPATAPPTAPVVKHTPPSAPAPPIVPGVKNSSAPGVKEAPAPVVDQKVTPVMLKKVSEIDSQAVCSTGGTNKDHDTPKQVCKIGPAEVVKERVNVPKENEPPSTLLADMGSKGQVCELALGGNIAPEALEPASAKTLELNPALPSKVETKHPEGQNLKAASVEQKTTEKDTHPGHQQQTLTALTQKKDLPKAAKKVLKKNGDKMRPKEGRAAPEVKGYIRDMRARSAQRPDNKTPGPRAQDEPSPRHVSCEEEDVLQRTATGPDEGAFVPA